jgi:hypothetical protein
MIREIALTDDNPLEYLSINIFQLPKSDYKVVGYLGEVLNFVNRKSAAKSYFDLLFASEAEKRFIFDYLERLRLIERIGEEYSVTKEGNELINALNELYIRHVGICSSCNEKLGPIRFNEYLSTHEAVYEFMCDECADMYEELLYGWTSV